jgi:rSAM/selenodomain-associated transferase 2
MPGEGGPGTRETTTRMAPVLSIVVPVLDEAVGIGPVLAALQPLRARGVELIVVDGGSRDGTPALAAPWVDAVVDAPRGRARQMNAGAAVAHGEALLFVHADTRLPDDADARVAAALGLATPDTMGRRRGLAASSGWGRFDVRIDGRSAWLPVVAALMNRRSRWTGIATGDQAIFVRRSAFIEAGGYPEQPLMEDIELSKRLKRLGSPACLRQRVITSGRRWECHGVWRTILLMWRLRFDYWRGIPAAQLAARYETDRPTARMRR